MKCSLCGESYRCEGCQRYDTYVGDEVEESIIDLLRNVNATLLYACEAVLEVLGAKCSYDHHGLCQEHHLRTDANGNPECEVKLLLDAINKAKGTRHGSKNL